MMLKDKSKRQARLSHIIYHHLKAQFSDSTIYEDNSDCLRFELPLADGTVWIQLVINESSQLVKYEAKLDLICPPSNSIALNLELAKLNAEIPLGAFYLDNKSYKISYAQSILYGDQGLDLSALIDNINLSLLILSLEYGRLRKLICGLFSYDEILEYIKQMKVFTKSLGA